MAHLTARSGKYRFVNSAQFHAMPFRVDMAGFDRCAPDYYLSRENSPISVVGYTLRGTGSVTQNGKTLLAEQGSLFMVNQGDSSSYYPVSDWEFCWVNLEGSFWRELLCRYGLEQTVVFPDFEMGEGFAALIRAVTHEETDLSEWQIKMQTFLYQTVLQLFFCRQLREEQTLAQRLRTQLEGSLGAELTQEAVCRRMGITPRHAQRIFKQKYGMTIHDYLTEKRLEQAKALLCNTDSSIRRIGEEIGFENEKYFSTFFHKHTGFSPSEYRRQHSFLRRTDIP